MATAVLGLGNIGPEASKPVMEGKAVLFKKYAGIDSFDIEIDEEDPDAFIKIVKSLEPTFGGINLEDIKAPECFKIETELREMMNIPIMHDYQMYAALVLGTSNKHGSNFRVLSMAPHRHALRRDDAHTLSLRVLGGGRRLATPMERGSRSPARPLATGDGRGMQGATVTVTATEAGHPTALRLQSVRPLAEPGVCLLEWRDGALRPLAPPAVGDEVVLGHWPGPMGQ